MHLGHQSAHPVMEDLPSPVKTREEKKEKDELSRLARSFLSCARSQNCHWVIECRSPGSCRSEKGASLPSVGSKSESELFHICWFCVARNKISPPLVYFGCSAETFKAAETGKNGSLSAGSSGATRCDRFPLLTLIALQGDKRKHSRRTHSAIQCHTVAVSASARKWIHVICPLPEGTELLMAGLSIFVEPLYPISVLSQPIQLLLLIAFFQTCLSASLVLRLFLKGHQLSTMSLRGPTCPWPYLLCVWVLCVGISNWGWHCVCTEVKGRGFFLSFAECLKKTADSWLVKNHSIENEEVAHHCNLRQQSFKVPQSKKIITQIPHMPAHPDGWLNLLWAGLVRPWWNNCLHKAEA